jgi:dTDP-4-dehydrorhamnose reductase
MKIAIIGVTGFLGSRLNDYFSQKNEVVGASIDASRDLIYLDATNKLAVENFLKREKPRVVIDTVALTNSVICEKNYGLCKKLNFETAKNISSACKKINAKMVFISSSYVFDGKRGNYSEKDVSKPITQYGKYKLLAEKEVLKLKDALVLRVDLMYGIYLGKLRAGTSDFSKKEIELGYPNQLRSPIFIEDVSRGIEALINKEQNGLFHIAGPNKIKMIDFIRTITSCSPNPPDIKIVDSSNFIVKSPENSTLNILKIKKLGIETTSIKDSLLKIRAELKNK